MESWQVTIPSTGRHDDVILYNIQIWNPANSARWVVQRRYNAFRDLETNLKARCSELTLPALPPKKYDLGALFGAPADSQTVEVRRQALEKFLQSALADPKADRGLLRGFLDPSLVADLPKSEAGNVRPYGVLFSGPPAGISGLTHPPMKGSSFHYDPAPPYLRVPQLVVLQNRTNVLIPSLLDTAREHLEAAVVLESMLGRGQLEADREPLFYQLRLLQSLSGVLRTDLTMVRAVCDVTCHENPEFTAFLTRFAGALQNAVVFERHAAEILGLASEEHGLPAQQPPRFAPLPPPQYGEATPAASYNPFAAEPQSEVAYPQLPSANVERIYSPPGVHAHANPAYTMSPALPYPPALTRAQPPAQEHTTNPRHTPPHSSHAAAEPAHHSENHEEFEAYTRVSTEIGELEEEVMAVIVRATDPTQLDHLTALALERIRLRLEVLNEVVRRYVGSDHYAPLAARMAQISELARNGQEVLRKLQATGEEQALRALELRVYELLDAADGVTGAQGAYRFYHDQLVPVQREAVLLHRMIQSAFEGGQVPPQLFRDSEDLQENLSSLHRGFVARFPACMEENVRQADQAVIEAAARKHIEDEDEMFDL